jgi:hypothetical protein
MDVMAVVVPHLDGRSRDSQLKQALHEAYAHDESVVRFVDLDRRRDGCRAGA